MLRQTCNGNLLEIVDDDIIYDVRLVLDTDVIVAAARSPAGASAELLRVAGKGKCRIILSVALALEYESVLMRANHLTASGMTAADVADYLDGIVRLAEPADIHFRYRPVTRDAADEQVVEAAVNGRAHAIVTFNRRDFGTGPSRFGIGCWLPRETLEKLE
jgi:putative PIN family toxin of toxin-antitoxin system